MEMEMKMKMKGPWAKRSSAENGHVLRRRTLEVKRMDAFLWYQVPQSNVGIRCIAVG